MTTAPANTPTQPVKVENDVRHDFDFLFGRWTTAQRRLQRRLAQCTDWDAFTGVCQAQPLLGGLGNVDDNLLHLPVGDYCAATLRAFDPSSGDWRIWWLDGRCPDRIDTPVVGRFHDGNGTFYADESFENRPIRVRFLWLGTQRETPRWEQAFSADGGLTWETNWTMVFTRAA